jgi:hypothetical protein
VAAIAIIASYFSAFENGELEPNFTHFLLLGGAIVGSLIVATGIALEAHWPISRMKRRELIGITFVFIGVGLEALFTIGLFVFDEGIGRGQQSTILGQQSKIIALETKLAPRELSEEQKAKIVDILNRFSGQKYQLSVDAGSETAAFACAVDKVLKKSGWVRVPTANLLVSTTICEGSGPIELNLLSAVHVRINPDASLQVKAALLSLANALKEAVIEAYPESDPTNIKDAANIAVMIGAKL